MKYANGDQQVNCRDLQFAEYSSVIESMVENVILLILRLIK